MPTTARLRLGPLEEAVESALEDLRSHNAVERIWSKDHTLWQADPTECANRLGWLDTVDELEARWEDIEDAADELADSVDRVVILGMGGSSLFPEVLARTFEAGDGFPELAVCDTTHPVAVRRILEAGDPTRTLVVAASKSGSTIETRSHLALFRARLEEHLDADAGGRLAAITDPGSPLSEAAREAGFAHVWENNPDIGGRFSALSHFGMVPAALLGLDGTALLDAAAEQADALRPLGGEDDDAGHLGLTLGAVMAAAARSGRDQLTIVLDERLSTFGLWLEQLIAESTGKHGVGVVPVVGEPLDHVLATPDHRTVVTVGEVAGVEELASAGLPLVELGVDEPEDLAAQVFLWEWATAACGAVLGINPFDQPDVESAKVQARAALAGGSDAPGAPDEGSLESLGSLLREGDHLAVCAFVDPELEPRLQAARLALGRRYGVATTLGLGPRFLHSTGQLHKGGADRIVVVQVVDAGPEDADLAVPGEDHTFGRLIRAQADGDLAALAAAGRRAIRVPLDALLGSA